MKKSDVLQGLSFITQLGLSVATPPVVCVFVSLWAQKRWELGDWVVPVGLLVGIASGVSSFLSFLRTARRKAENKEDTHEDR